MSYYCTDCGSMDGCEHHHPDDYPIYDDSHIEDQIIRILDAIGSAFRIDIHNPPKAEQDNSRNLDILALDEAETDWYSP
jgi:hypothetical protein